MLYNYVKYKGPDVTGASALDGFNDAGKISGWTSEAVRWAIGEEHYRQGRRSLGPSGFAVCAEVAVMLLRIC